MNPKSSHSTFHKNMQTLSKFYPFSEDLSQTFVKVPINDSIMIIQMLTIVYYHFFRVCLRREIGKAF